MMFRGKKGFIPVILGAGRAAVMAGRGIAAVGRGVSSGAKWGLDPVKDHPASQWVANHPIVRGAVNNRIINNPATRLGAGAVGLMGGLALAGVRGGVKSAKFGHELAKEHASKKSALILIVPIVLTLLDVLFNINGVPLTSLLKGTTLPVEILGRILTSAPYWAAVIIYWIVRKPHETGEWGYPLFLFGLGFFILAFSGMGFWVFYHCLFALFTFAYLLDGFNSEVRISASHWVFLLILFMDIFGLATINELYPDAKIEFGDVPGVLGTQSITIPFIFLNRLLFPYWFFFYLFLVQGGTTKTIASVLLTILYTGYALGTLVGVGAIETTDLEKQTGEAKNAVVKAFENWRDTAASWFKGRIEYAITGKVEENEFEPLGVYLENVQSADPRYYEDEDVIVWGTVTARTLDDPINIKVGCFAGDRKDGKVADKVDPENKFTVFTLEDNDFACTFGGCSKNESPCENPCNPQDPECKTVVKRQILKTGGNTITTFADFNFETLAFLKVYFMNRERQRAMVRQGLDPFDEFAIDDRNPIAVYTNGPAKIEMGTTSPLVGVSQDYIVKPSLDLRIDNREGWQGEIKRLKELVLFLPENIIFNPSGQYKSCNMEFLDYRLDACGDGKDPLKDNCCNPDDESCMACTQSCEKFVKNECLEVCGGYINPKNNQYSLCIENCGMDDLRPDGITVEVCREGCKASVDSYASCKDTCNKNFETCKTTCSSFFDEGGQEYNGYALDVNSIKYKSEEEDFKKGKLFRCTFVPEQSILGASPFTTKSFRVKVRYDYNLEKDVSVDIKKLPEPETEEIKVPSGAMPPEDGAEALATLFSEPGYGGIGLPIYAHVSDLDEGALDFNDKTSSIKVKPGYVATLYDHEEFDTGSDAGPRCHAYTKNKSSLDNYLDEQASSIKVEEFKGAVVYNHPYFYDSEDSKYISSQDENLGEGCEEGGSISSVKVASGYNAILYRNVNYNGETDVICSENTNDRICIKGDKIYVPGLNLGEVPSLEKVETILDNKGDKISFNDAAKSVRIIEGGEAPTSEVLVTLYSKEGESLDLVANTPVLSPADFDNKAVSFDLKENHVVKFYEEDNYGGWCRTYINSLPVFDYNPVITAAGTEKGYDISSVEIFEGFKGAIAYEKDEFTGKSNYYFDDDNDIEKDCEWDGMSSIKVAPGYQAILYRGKNFNDLSLNDEGEPITYCDDENVLCIPETVNMDNITEVGMLSQFKQFNDEARSIVIIKPSDGG